MRAEARSECEDEELETEVRVPFWRSFITERLHEGSSWRRIWGQRKVLGFFFFFFGF